MVLEEVKSASVNIDSPPVVGMIKPVTAPVAAAPPTAQMDSVSISSAIGVPKVQPDTSLAENKPPRFIDGDGSGYYIGEMSADGKERHGQGKMIYDSGAVFTGTFVSNKFHGKGSYHWFDGDDQDGVWKDNQRHGPTIFRSTNTGEVQYSFYEEGVIVGEGIFWSADRKTALKLTDGKKDGPMSLEEAEKMSKETFGFPVPPAVDMTLSPFVKLRTKASAQPGILRRLFPQNGQLGEGGKRMFKDNGEWGLYDGLRDASGRRQGLGKMKYDSGNSYEGPFLNDKYHGDNGVYKWADGDEYVGQWKDGERNGLGYITRKLVLPLTPCEGVEWIGNRKSAYQLMNGRDSWKYYQKTRNLSQRQSISCPWGEEIWSSWKIFKTKDVSPDGKPMFKDNGEWGTYEGDSLDEDGERQGTGKMTYSSGNTYEGPFLNNKYHGETGIYKWADGDKFEGQWRNGERHGVGIFTKTDGDVSYSNYDNGETKGEGIQWNADRSSAHKMKDGEVAMELLPDEAEKFARKTATASGGGVRSTAPAPKKMEPTSIIKNFFSSKAVTADGKLWFKDNGEWGTYNGDPLDDNGDRQGNGKMTYASGNTYEGGFVDNKYNSEKGIYRWADGDMFEGPWKDGERDGAVCIYRKADEGVEYSGYVKGQATVERWKEESRVSLSLATKLAKEKFNLPAPEKGAVAAASTDENTVVPKVTKRFTDFNDSGNYAGPLDKDGKRHGVGKMIMIAFEGPHKSVYKQGTYRWKDGDTYVGQWKDGKMNGTGVYQINNVGVCYSLYEDGLPVGVGVYWTNDKTKAFRTLNGVKMDEIKLTEASELAMSKFKLPAPKLKSERVEPTSRIKNFFSSKAVTADGKLWFKDNGEWGTYEGVPLDKNGDRQGDFVNNKYNSEKGTYKWADGDTYEGPWKDGERHGAVGIYRKADGSVEYSGYVGGQATGEGLFWEPDRKRAYKLLDGARKSGVSPAAAEKLALEKFKLPVPNPVVSATSASSKPEPTSRIMGLFRSKAVTADGKLWFKDNGEWGTYEGDPLDGNGDRQGNGKMTYASGNTYEGGFLNNTYHSEKGIYRWSDGDYFEGPWKDGERDGAVCIYRKADGTVEYSAYVAGQASGDGVYWSSDRKKAFKFVNGEQKGGMSLAAAEKLAKEKFSLPVPKK
ncbi:phosphatidylinositol-4-phosphate 5-kinase-related protein [Skeletonema marinoi]|uniref:Phosphatidylinositol-4-phosphate 5-kinase-related protein n=1 Tax=Skeletonema marinoi TaxID=267567 RepID=A0AAD9DJP9_9STRA|nr:phosphatidylinositol-4-phosphate 5-kinase-related protein [Skeletonema marinoi]